MLEKCGTNHKDMDTLIGLLNYLGISMFQVHNFICRLQQLQFREENIRYIEVSDMYAKFLDIHFNLLEATRDGINMNLLSYGRPTHCYQSNA